jgi:hypothetical protein
MALKHEKQPIGRIIKLKLCHFYTVLKALAFSVSRAS